MCSDSTGTDYLVLSSGNNETNGYTKIEKLEYRIDANDYLHFTTELEGDLIISENPLEKK